MKKPQPKLRRRPWLNRKDPPGTPVLLCPNSSQPCPMMKKEQQLVAHAKEERRRLRRVFSTPEGKLTLRDLPRKLEGLPRSAGRRPPSACPKKRKNSPSPARKTPPTTRWLNGSRKSPMNTASLPRPCRPSPDRTRRNAAPSSKRGARPRKKPANRPKPNCKTNGAHNTKATCRRPRTRSFACPPNAARRLRRQPERGSQEDAPHPLHEAYMKTNHSQHKYDNELYDRLAFGK